MIAPWLAAAGAFALYVLVSLAGFVVGYLAGHSVGFEDGAEWQRGRTERDARAARPPARGERP